MPSTAPYRPSPVRPASGALKRIHFLISSAQRGSPNWAVLPARHILGNLFLLFPVCNEHDRDPTAAPGFLEQAELLTGKLCSVVFSPAALAAQNGLEER